MGSNSKRNKVSTKKNVLSSKTKVGKKKQHDKKKKENKKICHAVFEEMLTQSEQLNTEAYASSEDLEMDGSDESMINEDKRIVHGSYEGMDKLLSHCDVILQVLDARDPMGYRCPAFERMLKQENKRLIFILNKSDLVPKENLFQWCKVLSKEYPTVAFKSSIAMNPKKLIHTPKNLRTNEQHITSSPVGCGLVFQLLRYYRQKEGMVKNLLDVGVVGLPNVGKFSVISSLVRSKFGNVEDDPSPISGLKSVTMDEKFRLFETPAYILPTSLKGEFDLRSSIKFEKCKTPMTIIDDILGLADLEKLAQHYRLGKFDTPDQFIELLTKKVVKGTKSDLPEETRLASGLLNDWAGGHLKHYTDAPEVSDTISEWEAFMISEFGLEEFKPNADKIMRTIQGTRAKEAFAVASMGPIGAIKRNKNINIHRTIKSHVVKMKKKNRSRISIVLTKKPDWTSIHKEVDMAKGWLQTLRQLAPNTY